MYIVTVDRDKTGIPFPIFYSTNLKECQAAMGKVARLINPRCKDINGDGMSYSLSHIDGAGFQQFDDEPFIAIWDSSAQSMLAQTIEVIERMKAMKKRKSEREYKEYEFKMWGQNHDHKS